MLGLLLALVAINLGLTIAVLVVLGKSQWRSTNAAIWSSLNRLDKSIRTFEDLEASRIFGICKIRDRHVVED